MAGGWSKGSEVQAQIDPNWKSIKQVHVDSADALQNPDEELLKCVDDASNVSKQGKAWEAYGEIGNCQEPLMNIGLPVSH
jgi:hypothetical protein